MYIAFTQELKYDHFGCGSTKDEAIKKLKVELKKKLDPRLDGYPPVKIVIKGSEIKLANPSFHFGEINTSFMVIEVGSKGVAQFEEKPEMAGQWLS